MSAREFGRHCARAVSILCVRVWAIVDVVADKWIYQKNQKSDKKNDFHRCVAAVHGTSVYIRRDFERWSTRKSMDFRFSKHFARENVLLRLHAWGLVHTELPNCPMTVSQSMASTSSIECLLPRIIGMQFDSSWPAIKTTPSSFRIEICVRTQYQMRSRRW